MSKYQNVNMCCFNCKNKKERCTVIVENDFSN